MAAPPNGNGHAEGAPPSLPARLRVGEPAPEFTLPDLAGKAVKLGDFHGSKTLLLFWNPGCGFCQRMLEDLKAWEAEPPRSVPRLLVISKGTVEANKVFGLKSTVVLDEGFMGACFLTSCPFPIVMKKHADE